MGKHGDPDTPSTSPLRAITRNPGVHAQGSGMLPGGDVWETDELEPDRPRRSVWPVFLVLTVMILSLFIGWAIGRGPGLADTSATMAPTPTKTVTASPEPAPTVTRTRWRTAEPEPGPTVFRPGPTVYRTTTAPPKPAPTVTTTRPGPTVRVTVTATVTETVEPDNGDNFPN